jgi:hypothetical protein
MQTVVFTDYQYYRQSLHLVVNCGPEELVKYMLKKYKCSLDLDWLKTLSGGCINISEENKGSRYLIWLRSFDWTVEDQGTLNHELDHFIYRTLRDRGIPLSADTEEVYTYYRGFWFRKIYVYLKRFYKSDKTKLFLKL